MAMVDCPNCGKRTRYAPDNPSRPFCSPHCKAIDLGAWATDSYVISGKATDNTTEASTPLEDQPPRRTEP